MAAARAKRLGAGLVMLSAHVEPALRDRVREEAERCGLPVSTVVTNALCAGLAVIQTDRERRASIKAEIPRAPRRYVTAEVRFRDW